MVAVPTGDAYAPMGPAASGYPHACSLRCARFGDAPPSGVTHTAQLSKIV
jgi:hypothetical protein